MNATGGILANLVSQRATRRVLFALIVALGPTLAGCTHVPFDYPKTVTSTSDVRPGGDVQKVAARLMVLEVKAIKQSGDG